METNPTRSKFVEFLRSQGFYVALALCLLIVGAAVVVSVLPNTPEQQQAEPSAPQDILQQQAVVRPDPTSMPVIRVLPGATATAVPAPTELPVMATSEPAAQTVSAPSKAAAPVQGQVNWEFAMDRLIYSKTLDQWTTHSGVDIACEQGTKVKAVMAGTVEEVREDDALGFMVTVSHPGDKKSVYANLSGTIPVKAGDKVNAGDTLGTVGSSSMLECGDESHLHFGFFVKGKAVDPAGYVRLGSK